MSKEGNDSEARKEVAPGYPAIEALRGLDVTGWEPAAVFHPVDLSETQVEGGQQ